MKHTILTIASILLCFQFSFAQQELDINLHTDGGSNSDTTKVTNNGGSELCTFEFSNADISTAKYICSKSAFSEPYLAKGIGENEITIEGSLLKETHTAWYRFDIIKPGVIELSLIPLNPNDDLDFVLYQLNQVTSQWEIVRASTSGPAIGSEEVVFCNGNMAGLQKGDTDLIEKDGCLGSLEGESDKDGFVQALEVNEDEQYLLCINNFLSCEGFSAVWGGESFLFRECPIKNKFSSNTNPYNNTYVSELYPNPSNEDIKIDIYYPNQYNNKTTNTEIKVLDITGKQLMKKTTELQRGNQSISFDVSDLAQGMYQIIFTLDGAPYTRKFIKQ